MVLEFYGPTTIALAFNKIHERLSKAKALDVDQNKSYMKYYNFCQHYKDYFVINETISQNQVSFTIIFLKNRVLYYWQ